VTLEDVPANVVAKHKEILVEVAKQSGKPDNILEKIVQGQLQKQLNEICLVGQPFFKDTDKTVGQLLKTANANVLSMTRYVVGEGIEVVKKSFEEEVAAARGGNA
jgi:elongation factor Ts